MSKQSKTMKPLALAIGTTLAGTVIGLSGAQAAASNPFAMSELSSGYMVADMEGKCGGNMKDAAKKDAEGKCGGNMKDAAKKDAEGKCGGNMKGEAKKDAEGKCGGNMKDEAAKKGAEGKCGTGKCGGNK